VIGGEFRGNNAVNEGGAMYLVGAGGLVDGVVALINHAGVRGGAMVLVSEGKTVKNSAIFGNNINPGGHGSGIYIRSSSATTLAQVTIHGNIGGDESGIYVDPANVGGVSVTNAIITYHTRGVCAAAGQVVTVDGVLWNNTDNAPTTTPCTGTVNVSHAYSGDPVFASDGYHLAKTSPAIDKGINSGVTRDMDGEWRVTGKYDLGADEYWLRSWAPVVRR
jgi:hypothetical protein